MIRRFLPVALALLACSARPTAAQDVGVALGSTPTPPSVQDLDGNAVDLGRYIGTGPVLLEFWATWCPICRALEPRIAEAHARFGDRVTFLRIGVAVNESPRSIRRHLKDHPMPGTVLYDARGAATRAFEAPTTSYIVVLDGKGRVVYTGVGEDQDIDAALEKATGE